MAQFTTCLASTIGSPALVFHLHRIHKRGGEPSNLHMTMRSGKEHQLEFASICTVAAENVSVQQAPVQNNKLGRAHIQETR